MTGCVLLALAATAASPRTIGLAEAITLALRHNPALGAAVADVEAAEGDALSARGLDDLLLELGGAFTDNQLSLGLAGDPSQASATIDASGSLQLTQPIPTGGKLGLRLSAEWLRSRVISDSISDAHAAWSPSLQLVLQHPLLRGAGERTARAQRHRAEARRDQATLARASAASLLLRDVVSAYWELVFARREHTIRAESAASAREQLQVVEAGIAVGKQPPSASAEVRVAIGFREEEALLAEQAARERSLELERLIGLPLDAETPRLEAADTATQAADARPASTGELLDDARAHNPQLAAAHANQRAAAVDVDVTENGMLPQLDVALSGGPAGNARTFGPAFEQMARFEGYAITASLIFSEPLQRHSASGARQTAQAGLHKARLSAEEIELQLETAVLRLSAALETARKRIELLGPATDSAALDLEAERARFTAGRASNFDVLRRQEELAQARLRTARAHTDYLQTLAALGAVTGELLERYQVTLR